MPAPFKPITPGAYLSDQVADVMAAEIRSGRLAAGDKLPTEASLVNQFSVSRTVVREAMSRLKSLGLIESRQGSGVFVKEIGFSPLNFDAKSTVSRQAVIQMFAAPWKPRLPHWPHNVAPRSMSSAFASRLPGWTRPCLPGVMVLMRTWIFTALLPKPRATLS